MTRESLPLAPEIVVDQHSRFEKPEDSPLYSNVMALLAELRERFFVLSHSGGSDPTRNPKWSLAQRLRNARPDLVPIVAGKRARLSRPTEKSLLSIYKC